jgi:hypothetical protein
MENILETITNLSLKWKIIIGATILVTIGVIITLAIILPKTTTTAMPTTTTAMPTTTTAMPTTTTVMPTTTTAMPTTTASIYTPEELNDIYIKLDELIKIYDVIYDEETIATNLPILLQYIPNEEIANTITSINEEKTFLNNITLELPNNEYQMKKNKILNINTRVLPIFVNENNRRTTNNIIIDINSVTAENIIILDLIEKYYRYRNYTEIGIQDQYQYNDIDSLYWHYNYEKNIYNKFQSLTPPNNVVDNMKQKTLEKINLVLSILKNKIDNIVLQTGKTYTMLEDTNIIFARIDGNANNYTEIGSFDSYDKCIEAVNINPNKDKIKGITWISPERGYGWGSRCFGIYDLNTKVREAQHTTGISNMIYCPANEPCFSATYCAHEGETCQSVGKVIYGANNKFITKIKSGPVPCNNTEFSDVAPGVRKACFTATHYTQNSN